MDALQLSSSRREIITGNSHQMRDPTLAALALGKSVTTQIRRLEEMQNTRLERIDLLAKEAKSAIDRQIESVRKELDKIQVDLKAKVAQAKKNFIKSENENNKTVNVVLSEFKKDLVKLKQNKTLTFKQFAVYQNNFKRLDSISAGTRVPLHDFKFHPSTYTYRDEDSFGSVRLNINSEAVILALEAQCCKIIPVNFKILNLCALSQQLLVSSNNDDACLRLLNDRFEEIKRVTIIGGEAFKPFAITTDDEGHIYLIDALERKKRILKTDLNFEIEAVYGDVVDFDPYDICYSNGKIYVTNSWKQQVLVLNQHLRLQKIIKFDFEPLLVRANDTHLCITRHNGGTCFYSLENSYIPLPFSNGENRISAVNASFYEISQHHVYCYGETGNKQKKILMTELKNYVKCAWDGSLFCNQNGLYVISHYTQKILKIK